MVIFINPLTSPREGVTVFTSPYLSAGAPALGEAKGLIETWVLEINEITPAVLKIEEKKIKKNYFIK